MIYKLYFELSKTYYLSFSGDRNLNSMIRFIESSLIEYFDKKNWDITDKVVSGAVKNINENSELKVKLISREEFKKIKSEEHYISVD